MSELRQAIRNFLLPMTLREMRVEAEISRDRGDHARAGYIEEFIREVEAENE